MKKREQVFLQRKDDDRLVVIYESMTWKQTRVFLRQGWGLVNDEMDMEQ